MWRSLLLLGLCLPGPMALAERAPLESPWFVRVGGAPQISDGVVTSLAQDDAGLLWIGTPVGLVRYDGYQFKPWPVGDRVPGTRVGSRFVRTLLAAPGGVLWVGLEGEGLAQLDTASQRWTLFRPDAKRAGALAHGTVRALARDGDGVLWVGTTGGGLFSLAPGAQNFQRFSRADGTLPDDRVQALRVDRQGTLWVGTWRGLVKKPQGSTRFEPVDLGGADSGGQAQAVSMLGEGPDGRIWVGTRDSGLAVLEPRNGQAQWLERPTDTQAADPDGPGAVLSFVVASADEVWLGRERAMDLRHATTGALHERMRRKARQPWALAGQNVVALMRDAADHLWVGSYGGGLQRHSPSPGIWVRRGEGPEDSPYAEGDLRSLHQLSNGEVWAGTPSGAVVVFDAQLRVLDQLLPGLTGAAGVRFSGGLVGAITQAADGTVWVGSDSGIHSFGPNRRLRTRHAIGGGRVRRLLAASDGSVWAATQDGVLRLSPGGTAFVRIALADGQTLNGNVNALAQGPDGTVWVGANAGLFRATPGQDSLRAVGAEPGAGLGSPVVLGLLVDRQARLWVDTNAGLHRWAAPQQATARFEAVTAGTAADGSAFGANLLEDGAGRIWTHQNIFNPADGRVQELGAADGVDIGTGWFRSYTRLSDGRLLFGGSAGVLVVTPGQTKAWDDQAPLAVTDLRINGQRVPTAALRPALVLRPDQRSFAVEVAALDYGQNDRSRYRHRLQGAEETWQEGGAELRVANYSNLSPGNYTLHFESSNRLGQWNPRGLTLPIEVLPAWWQSWWARTLAAGLALGALWGLLQLRTRFQRLREAELAAKVRERTLALETLSAELQRKSAELEASSLTDPLTGLHNRRFLTQNMSGDAAMSERRQVDGAETGDGGSDIVFFLIDLDHFKQVNDSHGHAAGDQVLQQVSRRLKQAVRESDHLVRWGGEEFLVVARDTVRGQAHELAERLLASIGAQPFRLDDGNQLRLSASIGFAAYPLAPSQPRALSWATTVDLADTALYVVKHGGRNGWLGLLQAQGSDAASLRQAAARPLGPWIASGGLLVQGSRPFQAE